MTSELHLVNKINENEEISAEKKIVSKAHTDSELNLF